MFLGGFVVLVALAAAGVWYFVIRDDAPAELSVTDTDEKAKSTGSTPASLDGEWPVGNGSQAGLRIKEKFVGGAAENTAVGRTEEVDGSITLAGTKLTEGSFTVDLASLEYTDDPPGFDVANRKGAMERSGLETGKFPDATFTLTQPVDFGAEPAAGEIKSLDVTGDLELHGVTKKITIPVEAQVQGDTIVVASADPVPIRLADYRMVVDNPPFIAEIADEGSFEFRLVLDSP